MCRSSVWDRAVELFWQIKGGQVDFTGYSFCSGPSSFFYNDEVNRVVVVPPRPAVDGKACDGSIDLHLVAADPSPQGAPQQPLYSSELVTAVALYQPSPMSVQSSGAKPSLDRSASSRSS